MRRSDGSTEWWPRHRPSPRRRELSRATSSRWCSQTSILIFSLQMRRPSPPQGACAKHSRVARDGTLDIACRATSTRLAIHIENSTIQMHHVEGYTDLEWPIDARNRIRNVLRASSVTPKRVLRSLRTQKMIATVYVKQRAQLQVRHGPLAHQNAQYLNQNMSPKRPARAHNRRKLCTCDSATPKNASRPPGIFLQS